MSSPAKSRRSKKVPESGFSSWPIEDLRLLKTEPRVDEDGHEHFIIYSDKLDAVTAVSPAELAELRERGLKEINELPE